MEALFLVKLVITVGTVVCFRFPSCGGVISVNISGLPVFVVKVCVN